MSKRRTLSPRERALWDKVTSNVSNRRGAGLRPEPVGPQKQAVKAAPKVRVASAKPQQALKAAPVTSFDPAPQHEQPRGLDGRNRRRLQRGKMEIEGRLDLHGMTEAVAHRALERFIVGEAARGKRLVLVITGKGKGRDWQGNPIAVPDAPWERGGGGGYHMPTRSGVLRRMVPQWLAQPPLNSLVVETAQAQPKHGGTGAIYVYLRRQR